LFGADVYPDLQTPEEVQSMLDLLQRANMNTVRVGEANWGNLEVAPGKFNFGWLREFLDNLKRRQMSAIVGTSTFVPPQWLVAAHPETLVVLEPGSGPSDPMSRKSPCLNHPLYREACRRYIQALALEFRDHPAILAWQLDNEIEGMVERICYNPACEKAWRRWLEKTYHSPEEFNRRLDLVSWGMKIESFDEVPQPRPGVEGPNGSEVRRALPALSLANLHFEHDVILDFLAEQAETLRRNGVRQWILTDWNPVWTALADEPKAQEFMSIAGLNYYQDSSDKPESWNDSPWHLDMHRSCYQKGSFIVTEMRFGVMGRASIWDPAPSREQFQMWDLQLAAFGASGMLYWTGNRWRGGHWPHWGGLMDWTGHAEPDFDWAVKLGQFFNTWGPTLLANPVKSSALVLTDFDQRAVLEIYPHIPESQSVFTGTFVALHRLGIGTDTINSRQAEHEENLRKYSAVLLPAATAFNNQAATEALHRYVLDGGIVIVLPFTAYMDRDGVFRGDGFGANLAALTGCLVRTVRWMGSPQKGGKQQQLVQWSGRFSGPVTPVGLDGFCEFLEVGNEAETIATFKSDQSILDGRPAATLHKLGKGMVLKLAFWPQDDSFLMLLERLLITPNEILAGALPEGVLGIPRTDGSTFVVNVIGKQHELHLKTICTDRISSGMVKTLHALSPYQVLWLEQHA
jgi:beta-galactosidase